VNSAYSCAACTGIMTTPMEMVAITTALPSIVTGTTSPKPTVVRVVTTCQGGR
jgi:hypothetical protein